MSEDRAEVSVVHDPNWFDEGQIAGIIPSTLQTPKRRGRVRAGTSDAQLHRCIEVRWMMVARPVPARQGGSDVGRVHATGSVLEK